MKYNDGEQPFTTHSLNLSVSAEKTSFQPAYGICSNLQSLVDSKPLEAT